MVQKKKDRTKYWKMYQSTREGKAHRLLSSARKNAKRLHVKFNLTFDWLMKKLNDGYCEVTDVEFTYEAPRKNHRTNPLMPSIDRLDNKKGYTKDNVVVCCWYVNLAKSTWNIGFFKEAISALNEGLKKFDYDRKTRKVIRYE